MDAVSEQEVREPAQPASPGRKPAWKGEGLVRLSEKGWEDLRLESCPSASAFYAQNHSLLTRFFPLLPLPSADQGLGLGCSL